MRPTIHCQNALSKFSFGRVRLKRGSALQVRLEGAGLSRDRMHFGALHLCSQTCSDSRARVGGWASSAIYDFDALYRPDRVTERLPFYTTAEWIRGNPSFRYVPFLALEKAR